MFEAQIHLAMEGGKCNQHTENAPFIVSEMEDRHMSKH
jgi:hypothetical protein